MPLPEGFKPTGRKIKSLSVLKEVAGLDPSLRETLQEAPGQVFITSGKRSPETNSGVGGVKNSYHLTGNALDLRKRTTSPETLNHFKQKGYQVIDEGDHYHLEPSKMPTIEEQIGKAALPDGFKPTGRRVSLQQLQSRTQSEAPASGRFGNTPVLTDVRAAGVGTGIPSGQKTMSEAQSYGSKTGANTADQDFRAQAYTTLKTKAAELGKDIKDLTPEDFLEASQGNVPLSKEFKTFIDPRKDKELVTVPADKAFLLAEGTQMPQLLAGLNDTIKKHKDVVGPLVGLRALNPWDKDAQTVQAKIDATKQLVGKFLEGGVLRKEDEDKYKKILATIRNTPEVAEEKLLGLNQLLAERYNAYLGSLESAGYDVGNFKQLDPNQAPFLQERPGNSLTTKDGRKIQYEILPD